MHKLKFFCPSQYGASRYGHAGAYTARVMRGCAGADHDAPDATTRTTGPHNDATTPRRDRPTAPHRAAPNPRTRYVQQGTQHRPDSPSGCMCMAALRRAHIGTRADLFRAAPQPLVASARAAQAHGEKKVSRADLSGNGAEGLTYFAPRYTSGLIATGSQQPVAEQKVSIAYLSPKSCAPTRFRRQTRAKGGFRVRMGSGEAGWTSGECRP